MTTGQKIREARRPAGLTVVEFASRIGPTETAVRFWEHGDRSPRFHYMLRIASVTGRPVESFGEKARGDAAADQAVHR